MKYEFMFTAVRASWVIVRMGQRVTRWADKWEETVRVPLSLNHRCAVRLLRLGGRIEAIGETLEAWADGAAQRLGCNMDYLMDDVLTARANAGR